jgi:hypothetical protein
MQKKVFSDRLSRSLVLGMILTVAEASVKPSYSYALLDISTDKIAIESIDRLTNISSESSSTSAYLLLQKAENLFDQGRFQDSLQQY